ncbi:DUF4282 domain-containing protein [Intrasporangium sp. DVR]|uniref:DUF4282 domain-containing protein n=1 Tax=Intrasporangium sp. DVR TaxID=3127867 RepID=UPI00313A5159
MTDQFPPEQGSLGHDPAEPPVFGEPTDPTTPLSPPRSAPTQTLSPQAVAVPPLQSAAGVAQESKGVLTALFDFSFTHVVTPKLVRFVYLLATVALGFVWLVWLVVGFGRGAGAGVVVLLLGPVLLVIYLAVIRMTLEFYLSVVRMSEDIHRRLPQA